MRKAVKVIEYYKRENGKDKTIRIDITPYDDETSFYVRYNVADKEAKADEMMASFLHRLIEFNKFYGMKLEFLQRELKED